MSALRLTRRSLSAIESHLKSLNRAIYQPSFNTVRCFSVSSSRKMKLLQFSYQDNPNDIRVGFLEGDDNIVDINKSNTELASTLLGILKNDDLHKLKRIECVKKVSVPLSSVNLRAPIHGMDKVLCIGLNYEDHCLEQKLKEPDVPMIFNKFPSTVIGPSESVRLRINVTRKVDWEVELVVVIGKKACFVKAEDAYQYVLGYTIAQDISARDWQKEKNMGQFLLGKSMDTFCPIGPWIVTTDEIEDPQILDISCSLNRVQKQRSNTCQLIHKIPNVIERLTSVMTLLPGDIILTGTPGGVGMYRQPPEYLKPGDVLTNTIQNIGVLEVRIEKF